jgi:UDP-glucose 4-epimerase
MTWLVTGGAGYIGAHVVRACRRRASPRSSWTTFERPRVVRAQGRAVRGGHDPASRAVGRHDARTRVTGVIHVAGFKYAGVSVQRPLHTYEQNVEGTRVVLAAMADAGVHNIVFSSSAAVYGTLTCRW